MFEESNESTKRTPPAGSFETLTNFLEKFKDTQIPSQIDKSVFPSTMSGGAQSFIQGTLKFFDLISSSSITEDDFSEIVQANAEQRQEIWARLVRSKYSFVFDGIDIERTTASVVADRFRAQGINGDTVRKAITFFLHASKAGNIKISPHVKAPRPAPTGTRQRKKQDPAQGGSADVKPKDDSNNNNGGGNSGSQQYETPYQMLIDILDAGMSDVEQDAVWTIIRYLKKLDANK